MLNKIIRDHARLTALAVLALAVIPADARNGVRIGLGAGLVQADDVESVTSNFNQDRYVSATGITGDDEGNSFTFTLGYQYRALLGIEVGFVDFGNYTFSGVLNEQPAIEDPDRGEWRLESRVTYIGYTPEIRLTERIELTGLVAAFTSNAKVFVSQPFQARQTFDENSSGIGYGAAIKYNFTDFAIQAGAKQFAGVTENTDMTLFDVGVYFTF